MSVYRHPDPVIESWLADGPSMLSLPAREGVSRAVRATRQRRIVVLWLPDVRAGRLLAAGGILLAMVLTISLIAGSTLLVPELTSTAGPTSSSDGDLSSAQPTADAAGGTITIERPWVILSFEYRIPTGLQLARGRQYSSGEVGYAWFTNGGSGAYGPSGRGVVVEEVTHARAHYSNGEFLGTDAASFLAAMAANEQFEVGEVSATTLDGRPALSAGVTAGHFDISPASLWVTSAYFDVPSHLIVADVDGAIVMVQIWAVSDDELQAWVPEALSFVNSMRFRVERAPGA